MQGTITNLNHVQAHNLLIEYQDINEMPNSKDRLNAITKWQQKATQYGKKIELKKVG